MARAAEDATSMEATQAQQELVNAQTKDGANAARGADDKVTREELRNVIEAIQKLEREKVSVPRDPPKFTDAG